MLIANNGIAAVKAMRSIRQWTYETFLDARLVTFVSLATPEDIAANAEFVRMADVLVPVPGGPNRNNYANVELVADVAERHAVDAVWAGWGHASENPALPARLAAAAPPIAFLGPPAGPMAALGDKIASTILAQAAGVPTVSWSGSGVTVDLDAPSWSGTVPDDVFARACVAGVDDAVRFGRSVGFPLVVKASEGGGGKGIRVVQEEDHLADAWRAVAGEVPGSPIFLMRLVTEARHLEVQLIADEHGSAIALYGRDCSVQRRHQKIIEEGPVSAAPPEVWRALEAAAVALAKAVGYVGAGTVEYLYRGDESGGEFYFLELNPRLQVEHPVTEWITGVNLPALQLQVAMGIPLGAVPAVRRFYGVVAPLDAPALAARRPVPPHGHVVAARITAENPDDGFTPSSGGITELTFRSAPHVWGYFSLNTGGSVHAYADSQIGHVFAWGVDRDAARRELALALRDVTLRGEIRTTVEYLQMLLAHPAFVGNRFYS